jgi:hypothetical protein
VDANGAFSLPPRVTKTPRFEMYSSPRLHPTRGFSLCVQVKNCIDQFEKVLDNPHCRFFGNVAVGNDGLKVTSKP